MKKTIRKGVSEKDMKLLEFDIYRGFEELEEVEIAMSLLGLYEKKYVIIRFLGQYYGVAAPSATKALVMGKDVSWIKESNMWSQIKTSEVELPFKVSNLTKGLNGNEGVLEDIEELDPGYELLNGYKTGWKDIRGSYQYATFYVDLLGRTFYKSMFDREDIPLLVNYGIASKSCLTRKFNTKRILKVNPFRTEALFVTGKIHRTSF